MSIQIAIAGAVLILGFVVYVLVDNYKRPE
jgi:hypothetical protein